MGFEVNLYPLMQGIFLSNLILGTHRFAFMVFDPGSLVMVSYTSRVKDADEIIETTKTSSGHIPKLVSIGDPSHPVLKGFNDALINSSEGQSGMVEIQPDQAYGIRNPKLVKMLNHRKLEDADRTGVGDTVTIGGKSGVVRFMGSGRVQVDFNHKYAGKVVVIEYVVVKHLVGIEETIDALLHSAGMLGDDGYSLEYGVLEVVVSPALFRDEKLQNKKFLVQTELFQFIPALNEIRFVEVYENKNKPELSEDDLGNDEDDLGDDLDDILNMPSKHSHSDDQ